MISGGLLAEMLKVGMTAFIAGKALKVMGKKDFADLITCIGWLSVGIGLITMWNGFFVNISSFMNFLHSFSIGTMVEGIKNILIK